MKGIIVETAGKTGQAVEASWSNSHPRLIDQEGLDGDCDETPIHCEYCAVSAQASGKTGRPWLAVKLESPGRVAFSMKHFESYSWTPVIQHVVCFVILVIKIELCANNLCIHSLQLFHQGRL